MMTADPASSGTVRVSLENGLIRHRYVGDQTAETVQTSTAETEQIVAELQAKHEPVLIMSDFSQIGGQTQAARNEMKHTLSTRYFDRIAAFGVAPSLRVVGQLMLNITGKTNQVRIFETEAEAEAWLREFAPPNQE
ncbi:MAG TPA: STAS/SEC14 domain-containing protein [Patescibacteria group bacterium]